MANNPSLATAEVVEIECKSSKLRPIIKGEFINQCLLLFIFLSLVFNSLSVNMIYITHFNTVLRQLKRHKKRILTL